MEFPRKVRYWHLVVLTDTFSDWPEDFSQSTIKAREISQE